ncbi:TetR family transcriptional regulator [Pseudomonas syringae]|nr:TetR family transcriptional regulator [Pseudomonas syringae]
MIRTINALLHAVGLDASSIGLLLLSLSTIAGAKSAIRPGSIFNRQGGSVFNQRQHSSRVQRDVKHKDLLAEREKNRVLRQEIQVLRSQVAKLASINEVLTSENRVLKAKHDELKVRDLPLGRV